MMLGMGAQIQTETGVLEVGPTHAGDRHRTTGLEPLRGFSSTALATWIMVADAAATFLAGLVTAHDLLFMLNFQDLLGLYLTAVVLGTVLLVVVFRQRRLYDFEQISDPAAHLRRIVPAVVLSLLLLVVVAYFLRLEFLDFPFARSWMVSWFALAGVAIAVVRFAVRRIVVSLSLSGRLRRNIAIVGSSEQAARLLQYLVRHNQPWNEIIGVFDDRTQRRSPDIRDNLRRGSVSDLVELVRNDQVDDIVIALPWSAEERIVEVVHRLDDLPVNLRLGSDLVAFAFPEAPISSFSGAPILDVSRKPLSGWRAFVKAVEDRLLAAILLVILSPILLAVAIAVRIDSPGPILFRQTRFGFNNNLFHLFKFRSMYHDRPNEPGTPQAKPDDPRITRVGAIIRRTSLDELPQLLNVLQGTMSLVGPRPHAVDHNAFYGSMIDHYFARHKVKPGITGWAQVNGLRGETDTLEKMKQRVAHDLFYIENWSPWFDLTILVRTVFVVLFQKSAY